MRHYIFLAVILSIVLVAGFLFFTLKKQSGESAFTKRLQFSNLLFDKKENDISGQSRHEGLSIESLKKINLTRDPLQIERFIDSRRGYKRYIAYYFSEGLKIYGLLKVPEDADGSDRRYPAVVFIHGYVPPKEYDTIWRYDRYTDVLAREGYIIFKPDLRGHANSEGIAVGGYVSNAYTIDVLNAIEAVKRYEKTDAENIGIWGHSMGGFLGLRVLVVRDDIKAASFWAGVMGSYIDLVERWLDLTSALPEQAVSWREDFIKRFGDPDPENRFWNEISATNYLENIKTPIQLQHARTDEHVPVEFSAELAEKLERSGKEVELILYDHDDHNLSVNFQKAARSTVDFFDRYLKSPR